MPKYTRKCKFLKYTIFTVFCSKVNKDESPFTFLKFNFLYYEYNTIKL